MVMTMSETVGVARSEWEALEVPSGYRAEMIQGELVLSPTPARPHVLLQNLLVRTLQVPDGFLPLMGDAWQIDLESPCVAREPQPDLVVVPRGLDPIVKAPLLAIEILSPSDFRRLEKSRLRRIEGKRLDYADAGLRHYVEIHPWPQSKWGLRRYELEEGVLVVADETKDVLASEVPFPYELDIPALLA